MKDRRRIFCALWISTFVSGFAPLASAQAQFDQTLLVGPAVSVDGFTPSSLNDEGEVAFADTFNQAISDSQGVLAQVDDMIGGERLSAIPAGSETSLNDSGVVAFRARYDAGGGLDLDAIFTQTDLIARQWGSVGGTTVGSLSGPSINAAGQIVFSATICPNQMCVSSGIFNATTELLRAPVSDGFVELTSVSDPVINDAGQVAFYGYAFLADTSGIYHLTAGPLARIVHTGETVAPGVVLDNPRGVVRGMDMNEDGDIATCWNTESGDWVVLRNGDLVAMAGDTIDGVQITEIPNHRPAIGEDGSVVFIARHAGGFGVFTPSSLVLSEGQIVGTRAIDAVIAVAINDEGTIGTHVHLEGDFYGIVLATPTPEPSTMCGAAACALTISALARRRRQAAAGRCGA